MGRVAIGAATRIRRASSGGVASTSTAMGRVAIGGATLALAFF
jgi:hypothetical protein